MTKQMPEPTDAQISGREAALAVDTIVLKLAKIGAEIRRYKPELERGTGTAVAASAEIINSLTQQIGALGELQWNLIHYANKADVEFRQAEADTRVQGYIDERRNEV